MTPQPHCAVPGSRGSPRGRGKRALTPPPRPTRSRSQSERAAGAEGGGDLRPASRSSSPTNPRRKGRDLFPHPPIPARPARGGGAGPYGAAANGRARGAELREAMGQRAAVSAEWGPPKPPGNPPSPPGNPRTLPGNARTPPEIPESPRKAPNRPPGGHQGVVTWGGCGGRYGAAVGLGLLWGWGGRDGCGAAYRAGWLSGWLWGSYGAAYRAGYGAAVGLPLGLAMGLVVGLIVGLVMGQLWD